jgi:hypothetical protein
MKRDSLPKSVCAFGLMAMLSVLIATTLQQPVQARSKVLAQGNAACVPLPTGVTFFELQGIEFSPKQKAEYKKILAKMNVRSEALLKRVRKGQSDGYLVTEIKEGVKDKIVEEIKKAIGIVSSDTIPDAKQVDGLTKRYGQYAKFSVDSQLVFTPAQSAERDKMTRDQEDQTLSILTPEQQKIYRANLVVKRGFEACDTSSKVNG